MKNIFVVNPAAGQKAGGKVFVEKIEETARALGVDFEVYMTKCAGDATVFVRERCLAKAPDEQLRFFACGGDGTHNEVVNGLHGFDGVSFGVVPIGTGNDFIRNFGTADQFLDIEAQLKGTDKVIDSITYVNEYRGVETTGCIVNMVNVGLDANAAEKTAELKKKPFISGSLAYILAVGIMFIKKKGANLKVESDGEVLCNGKVLLTAITNGCYCGGGWKGIPKALTNDGLLDISVVNDVSRLQFIRLVPLYQNGTHLETEIGQRVVTYRQKTSAVITSIGQSMRLCIDGEMVDSDKIELQVKPESLRFVIPEGVC